MKKLDYAKSIGVSKWAYISLIHPCLPSSLHVLVGMLQLPKTQKFGIRTPGHTPMRILLVTVSKGV